ncbi:MAG: hypothetical protein IKU48_04330 [Clostridia bacterium]|nr:hypothetical protein [Clostridia bacterium]
MIADRRIIKLITVVAVGLALLALVLGVVKGCNKEPSDATVELPTSNQILLGFKEVGSVSFDRDVLKNSVRIDERFSGYGLRDEYCMVYQVTDFGHEKKVKDYLGIKEVLPEVDYSKYYMLLSVGRPIEDISDRYKRTTDNGEKIVDFTFGNEYSENTVYVYSVKKTSFLSGDLLEIYYLENVHPNCNLEEVSRENSQLISEGKYHKVYKKAEAVYEFVIYKADGQAVSSRKILSTKPIITEYNDSMVRLEYEERDQYYNPQNDFYTTKSKYQLHHLMDTKVVFAKFSSNGDLLIVVRDAYNTTNYSYILRPPFSCTADAIRTLLQSVEYVDNTHVRLTFNFGSGHPLHDELVTVPDLSRKSSANQ